MVRITRFSFDEGMRVDDPVPRNGLDDEYDFIGEDDSPTALPRRPKKRRRRTQPDDRRPDRRQRPGERWKDPAAKDTPPTARHPGNTAEPDRDNPDLSRSETEIPGIDSPRGDSLQ